MTNRFDVLTQQVFQKNVIDCSVEELQNLADENPYFAPAQYALLTRLKDKDPDKYQAQFQKAILYYHDPLSFDQFINEESYSFEFATIDEPEIVLPVEKENEIEKDEKLEPFNIEQTELAIEEEVQADDTVLVEWAENKIIDEEPHFGHGFCINIFTLYRMSSQVFYLLFRTDIQRFYLVGDWQFFHRL